MYQAAPGVPCNDPNRRPSYTDNLSRARRHQLLAEEIRAVLGPGVTERGIQTVVERLLSLAAWKWRLLWKVQLVCRGETNGTPPSTHGFPKGHRKGTARIV